MHLDLVLECWREGRESNKFCKFYYIFQKIKTDQKNLLLLYHVSLMCLLILVSVWTHTHTHTHTHESHILARTTIHTDNFFRRLFAFSCSTFVVGFATSIAIPLESKLFASSSRPIFIFNKVLAAMKKLSQ